MQKNTYIFIFSLFLLFLFCCTPDKTKNISLHLVTLTDFEDILIIGGQTESVNSVNVVCPPEVDGKLVFIVEDGTYVKKGDVLCIIEDVNISTDYDAGLLALENLQAELEKLQAKLNLDYALLEAQVKNNEAETLIANLDSLQLEYLTSSQRKIKELQLEKTAIDKVRFQKKLDALAVIQQSDVKKMEIEIQRRARRVETAKELLTSLTVRAPRDGLALRADFYGIKAQVGDPTWYGRPLITLPDLENMQVKIFAPENDYKRININDSIIYTFDAMPENKAWGRILHKSPVGQPKRNTNIISGAGYISISISVTAPKVKFFEITASVDSSLVIPGAGLSANCHIYLQRLNDTIVVPSLTIFDVDSMKVVYVKQKNGFEMREIQTGISNYRNTVVSAGLKENEMIALMKPAEKMIKKRTRIENGELKIENDSIKSQESRTKNQDSVSFLATPSGKAERPRKREQNR